VFYSYMVVDIVDASIGGWGVKFQFVLATVCMKQAKIGSSACCVKINTQ
jgi:hypothetical protein